MSVVVILPNPELRLKLLPSLEKVFPNRMPESCLSSNRFSILGNDALSFQVGLYPHNSSLPFSIYIGLSSPLAEYITIRSVNNVASTYTAHPFYDDNYLMTGPGIIPDLLLPLCENHIEIAPRQWSALWVELNIPSGYPAGVYPIELSFKVPANKFGIEEILHYTLDVEIEVLPADLPEQTLLCTHWLYTDCIADYYDVEVFCEEHWRLIEKHIASAVRMGNNTLLTPIFTPPINTTPGRERMTTQLVDISAQGDKYSFGFEKLHRWVDMAQKQGITHFEMAHLFTQWGAEYTPKIVINGDEKRFGWHVRADSRKYKTFIDQFLPALVKELRAMRIAGRTFFHISDEPDESMYESYGKALALVQPHLTDFPIIDALSDFAFYEKGLLKKPVPATDHIVPFLEAKVPGLWAYYCIAQMLDVSNRFMGMPSARNRIIGTQLYKYDIEGFLHWGFNYYNTSMSIGSVNPFASNDAGQGFVSGDSFVVYPGKRGEALESIRYMVFREAMMDLSAFQLLGSLIGKEAVVAILEMETDEPLTFSCYPKSQGYLLRLRDKVNHAIIENLRQRKTDKTQYNMR